MYAILEISGTQEKFEKGKEVLVNRINKKEGATAKFSHVVFARKGQKTHIGTPYVKGASVECEVVSHPRGKKVTAFKMKRRKSYHKTIGHRQDMTLLKVKDIIIKD